MSRPRASTLVILVAVVILSGCSRRDAPVKDSARSSSTVAATAPLWLQPAFRLIDSSLTEGQRDTLRLTSLDSAYEYRGRLARPLAARAPEWRKTGAADTLIARGERLPSVQAVILLDLYQQLLQRRALDLNGALHRVSPDYVYARYDRVITDSTLISEDLDGSGVPDRLVRQVKYTVVDRDTVNRESQLALYLDAATAPAWASGFDEFGAELARAPIRIGSGGSLVVIHASGGDADEFTVVDAHAGRAREVVRHQIDYGEGTFSIREDAGHVLVTATREVQLGGKPQTPSVQCTTKEWPALVLAFDDRRREFEIDHQQCLPQE